MRKLLVLIFMFGLYGSAQSQSVVYLKRVGSANRSVYTTVGTTTEATWEFRFSQNKDKNPYSGWLSVVVFADTVSGALPTTVTVSADPLFYDSVSDAWEGSPGKVDSIDVEDSFNMVTNHSDNVYSISKAINVLACDGVKIYVYNTHATQSVLLRVELRMAEERK